MICDQWDVAVVPFPFTDRAASKRRPAVAITNRTFNSHGRTVMAMVTTSKDVWPADVPIRNLRSAGLPKDCKVRLKLFTLDNQLIVNVTGKLSARDQDQIRSAWIEAGLL